jgi:hypothetical protein
MFAAITISCILRGAFHLCWGTRPLVIALNGSRICAEMMEAQNYFCRSHFSQHPTEKRVMSSKATTAAKRFIV